MTRSIIGRALALLLLALLALLSIAPAASSQGAAVRLLYFYSEDCENCQELKAEFFPALIAQHGDQLEISHREIADAAIFEQMVALEEQFEVPAESADIPEVYIGDRALVGPDQIRAELPALIDRYLAQGGVDLPGQIVAQAATAEGDEPVARFYLFYGEACPHCHDVIDDFLPGVYEKYGAQVEYEYIEVWSDPDQYVTLLALETKLGVPEEAQGAVPVLIIGDKVMIGGADIPARLEGYIDEYLAQGGVDYPSLENLPEVVLPTPAPAVEMLILFDPNSPDAQQLTAFITALGQSYGSQLRVYGADTTQPQNQAIVEQLDTAFGLTGQPASTPRILVDRQMLVGSAQIERELPSLVEQYLEQGGSSLPSLEELAGSTGTETPTVAAPEATTETGDAGPPVHLAYFYKTGCQECDRAEYDLNFIQQNYPQVQIVEYNIEDNQALAEWLGEQLGVPEAERLEAPAIFIGADHLTGEALVLRSIQEAVERYVDGGAEPIWEDFGQPEQETARESLIERYKSLGALTVFAAGLVNGLNPCAFVTIVFFLSYLTFVGRGGKEILIVGAMFTLGVFVTYLLAGLGLSQVLEPLSGVQAALKRWVFGFTAVLCLALAGISLHDFIKARQGKTDEMKIKLSIDLRRRVNRVIREGSKMRAFYLVALGMGAIVSLIQLTCTSPIYIGIVFLIHDVPEMQSNALLYLLLYNLAYIVPLVIVFLVAYFGTSSEQLGDFITERTAAIKLLTVVVFLVMAGWLIYSLLPLFGVA